VTFAARVGVQESLIEEDSERYFRPPYVGGRGWVGAYLDGHHESNSPQWDTLSDLIVDAWIWSRRPRSAACSIPSRKAGEILRWSDVSPRHVVAISRGVEPHPHHSIRRGIVEDLLGALPIRIRLSDSPWRRKMRLRTKQTTNTTRTMAQTSPSVTYAVLRKVTTVP